MNPRIRNALLFFAALFTLVASLQYWFVKNQLHRTIVAEMNDWADEIVEEINYDGKWDLAGFRRANPEAPIYFVETPDGFLLDVAGLVEGMVPLVSLPPGLVYDQPFNFVSNLGEPWRLFARRVRGGVVILGVALSNSHPDVDDRLRLDVQPFGATIDSAAEVKDRQVNTTTEYAVVDASGRLINAAGGIPLFTKPEAVNRLLASGPILTIDGDPYFVISRPIKDAAHRDVATVVLFKYVALEQQMLHQALLFNLVVAGVCLVLSGVLAAVYFYGLRGPALSCEEAITKDESQTIEFKSSLRWDHRLGRANKDLESAVVKTVAAFLNTDGGVLMIGVSDDKIAVGLDADYRTLGDKPNKDGFLLTLQQVLSNAVGTDNVARYLRIEFCTVSGVEICVTYVKPARSEVFAEERTTSGPQTTFYIRVLNATKSLNPKETLAYIREHWGR